MDDPQNNNPNGQNGAATPDFSSFSGTYPSAPATPAAPDAAGAPTGNPLAPPPDPSLNPPPFTTETVPSAAPSVSDLYAPSAPSSTPGIDQSIPATSAPAPFDTTYTPPAADQNANVAAPVAPADNPFTVGAPPAPASSGGGGGLKRVLAVLLLLVALVVLGFLAFTFIGKFLAGNQQKTLVYWGLWENDAVIAPLIEEYQASHPKVKIQYERQDIKQYRERLQSQLDKGSGPDLFRFHNTWVPMLKSELSPAGATGYSAAEFKTTFYPVANSDLVVGGQVVGVPLMIDGLALYYNEDILRAAGINPPQSWEDFRNAASALTVKDGSGSIITAGAALGTTGNIQHYSDIMALMMLQNGVPFPDLGLDNPDPIEKARAPQALTFYKLFAEKPNNVWDATLDDSVVAFANRKVAMIFAPSWQVFTVRDLNPQLNFRVIPVPQLVGTNVSWASYWVEGVSSKSKSKDEAWDFLKFISSKENMVKLYTEEAKVRAFGEPYSRMDLADLLVNDPLVGAYIQQAPNAKSFFLSSRTFDNGINDRMIKYLEDAINAQGQGVSPDSALKTAAQGFSQVLNSYR